MNEAAQMFALSFFQNRGKQPTQRELMQFWVEGHKLIEELQDIVNEKKKRNNKEKSK